MRSNDLTRHYETLTVWERIPLLLAADARGDDAERRRLFDSSLVRPAPMSQHLMPELALHLLSLQYIAVQLENAGIYFLCLMHALDEENRRPERDKLYADVDAFSFVREAEAWREFCGELQVDGAALTASNNAGWLLAFAEERMPLFAPDAGAMERIMKEAGFGDVAVDTAEGWAEWYRSSLRDLSVVHPPPFPARRP
jgi:hypothetical protein